MKKTVKIGLTIILLVSIVFLYCFLEFIYHSFLLCGCSSGCLGFFPTQDSRMIGYFLLIASTLLLVASIWRIKKISRYWIIPALLMFGIGFYGNGYLISDNGFCGYSIYKNTFFIHRVKLGDFAMQDGETLDMDALQAGRYKGKLLGYSMDEKELTLYRIGEEPLKVKTSFLFWQTSGDDFIATLSATLHSYRNIGQEQHDGKYELIGGQYMPVEVFVNELRTVHQEFLWEKIKNLEVRNEADGTSRFTFEIDER